MKLFIVSYYIPYPLDCGGNISQFAILERLQDKIDITLGFPIFNDNDFHNSIQLQSLLPNVKIKNFDRRISKVETLSFRSIIKKKLKLLRRPSLSQPIDNYDELDDQWFIRPSYINNDFFGQINSSILEEKVDLIQIEFFEFLELGAANFLNIPKVFVHHEVRFRRLLRSATLSEKGLNYKAFSIKRAKDIEFSLLNNFNAVITFSDEDCQELQPLLSNPVEPIPFPILDKEMITENISASITKLAFIGGESHYPNKEGIKWFLSGAFEKLWERFRLPIYIIGKWSDRTVQEMSVPGKIIFTGFLENYDDTIKSSILIIPIRVGSGIRTKILYGMGKRVPVISTTVGAEGLKVEKLNNIFIADSDDEFVFCVEKVLLNHDLRNQIIENAFQYVRTNFSQEGISNARKNFYEKVLERDRQVFTPLH